MNPFVLAAITLTISLGATASLAQTSGTQLGSTQRVRNTTVSNGVFTVRLDFGTTNFPGADRFLEISARPTGSGSFTLLTPRQQVTSAPSLVTVSW